MIVLLKLHLSIVFVPKLFRYYPKLSDTLFLSEIPEKLEQQSKRIPGTTKVEFKTFYIVNFFTPSSKINGSPLLDEQHDHKSSIIYNKLVDLVLRIGVTSFSFPTNIFKARLGRNSTTLHLLKHHIKPHWLQRVLLLLLSLTSLDHGPAPTKVTMGFTILCISDIFCSVRFYVLKNAIASSIYFLAKASEGSF
jgi:hypothetical protein